MSMVTSSFKINKWNLMGLLALCIYIYIISMVTSSFKIIYIYQYQKHSMFIVPPKNCFISLESEPNCRRHIKGNLILYSSWSQFSSDAVSRYGCLWKWYIPQVLATLKIGKTMIKHQNFGVTYFQTNPYDIWRFPEMGVPPNRQF